MFNKITLNRATADNALLFCDAGSTLMIGDKAEAGTITLAAAQVLIDTFGAEPVSDSSPPPALHKPVKVAAALDAGEI